MFVFAAMQSRAETTIYVGKHFEVREHDAPVKYVFNGGTRVARITGSLSANERIQRLRLRAGWNLVSLAVTAPDFLGQLQGLTSGPAPTIQALYRWLPITKGYGTIASGESVAAGTVLWVSARTNVVVAVRGGYVEPSQWSAPGGETFLATPALAAQPLQLPAGVTIWRYDARNRRWQAGLAGDLAALSDLPSALASGEVIYIHSNEATDLGTPASEDRVCYYHQDHLGSSSAMTDADGALIEETAFYPFGTPRSEHRLRQVKEPYKFTQKERDRETGLHYFEARYLAGGLARFMTLDPMYANPDALALEDAAAFLETPQKMNNYGYTRNNPLSYVDPTGLDVEGIVPPPIQDEDEGSFMKSMNVGATIVVNFCDNAFGCGMGGYQLNREILTQGYKVETDSKLAKVSAGAGFLTSLAVPLPPIMGLAGKGAGKAAVAGGEAANVAKSTVNPLATTQAAVAAPNVVSKGAATGLSTGGGASAIRVAQAADAAIVAQQSAYMKIITEIQYSLMHLTKSGVHPSKVVDMAFKQADAVWISRFGTKPPGLR